VRGYIRRLVLPLAAVAVLVAAGSAGGASKAGTLVFAGAADPTYLDPALVSDGESFRVTEQIFEGLVKLKPGTTIVQPDLATKWKTKDAKNWTFTLRHGVKFHDGTPFNAAAVCYNYNRQYNFSGPFQDASATYYWQTVFNGFRHNESSNLSPSLYKGCTAHGKYSVTIHLTSPSGPFLSAQVISSFAIQSPTALKKYGANKGELRNGVFAPTGSYAFSHPTGTGPFKFQSWTVGQRVVLVKNKQFWGPKARINTLIIRPISDNTARLQALQTGEVQGYDLVAPEHINTIKSNSKLKVLNRPSFNVAYVTIHQGPGSPMNDLKVRQAVAYGLDRANVVRSFYAGRGVVAKEFMPPQLFGYSKSVTKYAYNPTKAKQLLNSSSCHVPCKVDFWYPTNISRPYMPDPKRNFEAFSASLTQAGFQVTAHSAPWRPDYVKHVNEGTAGDLNLIGWTGDFGDPDNFIGTFFQTYSPQFGFRNNAIFNILSKAEREKSVKKRIALYKSANNLIMKYLPAVPYAHSQPALGFSKSVRGYVPSPVGTDPFLPVFVAGGV
jgi:peptide/nickel transport system substrate-binding protein